ncbi:MAG: hypothetical protein H6817_03355 [Phycisphaerales bacterium]|nr:hypothetical protein [Phycisphaerales bacterium]
MQTKRHFAATIVLMLFAAAAYAQSNADARTAEFEQRVVSLKYGEAPRVAKLLQQFMEHGRVGFEERTNTVVIHAPANEVEMAMQMITSLDVQQSQNDSVTEIITLNDEAPRNLIELIQTMVEGRVRAAFDRASGALVVSGAKADIAKIHELVRELRMQRDFREQEQQIREPAVGKPLSVSFYFIQAMLGPENSPIAPEAVIDVPPTDPRDDATLKKLEKPVTINVRDLPIAHVLEELSADGSIDLNVDWRALESEGIGRDTPVTLSLREPAPLGQVLHLVLDQISGDATVTAVDYAVRGGLIQVSMRNVLDNDTYLQVYDVLELTKAVPRFALDPVAGSGSAAPVNSGSPGGGFGGGVGMGGGNQNPYAGEESGATAPDGTNIQAVAPVLWSERDDEPAENLIDLIVSTITPDDWAENGGNIATIQQINGTLVVKHNARGHRAIADLLNMLRERQAVIRARVSNIPPPAMLDPVMGTLAELGYRRAMLLAPLNVTVGRDERFKLKGSAAQFDRMLGVEVTGRAKRIDDDTVELQVNAEIGPKVALPGTLGGPEPMFALSSAVTAPLGDYIVLAASPGATDYGQAIMLVVRVAEVGN